jgi:hypothetical protein
MEMVEWHDIKVPCLFLGIGFMFVAVSLILFLLGENEGAMPIALVIGSALLLTTAMSLFFGSWQQPASRMRR